MTEIVTYYSSQAKEHERWLAYAVLPDGNQWLVRFTGSTEEIARSKCERLYESERAKYAARNNSEADDVDLSQSINRRGSHFAGKAWLIHKITRVKIRVPLDQVESYLGEYDRGGPRSK